MKTSTVGPWLVTKQIPEAISEQNLSFGVESLTLYLYACEPSGVLHHSSNGMLMLMDIGWFYSAKPNQ
jgi:hypothetical protein